MAEAIAQYVERELRNEIEEQARRHNAADLWDALWQKEDEETWRTQALARVYARASRIVGSIKAIEALRIADIGGGLGVLAEQLSALANVESVVVIDNSEVALQSAIARGVNAKRLDLEVDDLLAAFEGVSLFVSTECVEHLSAATRAELFAGMAFVKPYGAIISVPNNRLGPDEEPQHTVKFTAMTFKNELQDHFGDDVRVEVLGPYLLGVCGALAHKGFRLSATLPVRDEGHDLEPTLASLRGIADELIVGVDPRTTDNTWEVAAQYADKVFFLRDPMGPPAGHRIVECPICNGACKEFMGENGIHFSWARNQCIDQCTGDWIFMTEGHERLVAGDDVLRALDTVLPKAARVGFVLRQGNGQQWAFPWLFQNAPDIRFKRPVHNVLDFPEGTFCVVLGQVKTLHDRHHERGASRAKQRKAQNRSALLDDWLSRKSEASLFYLGQEWRDIDVSRALDRLQEFLVVSNNGVQRYQARLIVAKELMIQSRLKEASAVLHACTGDDWSRSEHFLWLGDIAYLGKELEKARRFYTIAASGIGDPPITVWWIDLAFYSYLPAQRLAMVCGDLGMLDEALAWCRRVVELLPDDSPPEAFAEARANVTLIEGALSGRAAED
jgi:2-polyprenyl-3-methyl-5-hydroxy-6-metoxy-1,4-benzoquinol methylase/glycosyltransferase involved in cell wall biosynthesis